VFSSELVWERQKLAEPAMRVTSTTTCTNLPVIVASTSNP
jgi:hypothetical protein